MIRAVVTSSFALAGGLTVLTLEILEGSVKSGDAVHVAMADRSAEVTVRSVEFVDYDIGRPTFRSEPAIVVEGIAPSEAPAGAIISS
ncbi:MULTISPECIES: hypothetical protein [unclassified Anaeromyxobacter]|uniref:hypothetical protein n=1 Tax=unclassified Anaeromyxobacter TaxID=2620896 RepID=UPI001F5864DE|nr:MULTISPECIES: hypothetical protein [unclassified Anaeromyxobacter]